MTDSDDSAVSAGQAAGPARSVPQPSPRSRLDKARAALQALDEGGAVLATCKAGPPPLRPLPCLELARGRVHEIAGTARHSLAVLTAGAAAREGPVIWLQPGWRPVTLYPQGIEALAGPESRLCQALILARCGSEADILATMEEALRAGCVALVLAEIGVTPDLRQIRRLHLAAAEGVARAAAERRKNGAQAPLGLLLAQERADSRIDGVESRWALHPLPPATRADTRNGVAPRWRLERLRARDAAPAQWLLADARVLPGAAGAAGLSLTPLAAGD